MALGSINASPVGRKAVGREARDLAVASFGGWQQALEEVASCGGGSKLWRRQQALEEVASSRGGSKL
jgi:hypothetical protein